MTVPVRSNLHRHRQPSNVCDDWTMLTSGSATTSLRIWDLAAAFCSGYDEAEPKVARGAVEDSKVIRHEQYIS